MAGMNRLSPLIVRRVGRMAVAAATPEHQRWDVRQEQENSLIDDAKLFATGWVGGLIFFGTLFS